MNDNVYLPKRSLAELDQVIEEIIQRNPDWVDELNELIDRKLNERPIERTND